MSGRPFLKSEKATLTRSVRASQYQRLEHGLAAAETGAQAGVRAIGRKLTATVAPKLKALAGAFDALRSKIAALFYRVETSTDREREKLRKELR